KIDRDKSNYNTVSNDQNFYKQNKMKFPNSY
ncbi:hypothetical protein M2459_003202, partial [Parabacteroides sp. PF5-5]|nr:hypothetical protein [Parabacteroides sp. PH5-39]MDH6316974.1 hypothetical protein [Parabacteroides sp. PF5-13]MDH6321044.1 hypothetical protein [Parabacteroides sp. PH5-13]MDH6324776.1 hypothetical protein [Parabacteroides sp. PH5-8]MDH6328159.1 hypothetical protein [Parabacteroides sp. PH5-41]MDH6335833.1 hypothetical protein [Parabacteroides sp. PF5-5]MDH6347025.1 hypothetical protein [Parabacteroides sp. PH5-46]MDH6361987.1 hypothetical protein [Parabacteroides sp. PH5-16]MDH6377655.